MLMVVHYVRTDIMNIEEQVLQKDTIGLQSLTIKELNEEISATYMELELKTKEVTILERKVEILKKTISEKKRYNTINILRVDSIVLDTAGNVIEIR